MRRRLPQVLRRALQLSVLVFIVYTAFGGTWRNYKHAHNHHRLVTLMEGEAWGALYAANESFLSLFGEPAEASLDFLGFPWAARIFGIDTADPILVASHSLRTGSVQPELLIALLIPLLMALLLGKIFCSHLCPMRLLFELGQAVRAGLLRLGIVLPEIRGEARWGGWVLLGGLIASTLSSGAIWFFVLPYVSLSASIYLLVTAGVATLLLAVVLGWFVIDLALAPGYFCRNVCPTGVILEQPGRLSLLRLVKRGASPCPSSCNQCQRVCPYNLLPKEGTHRPICDNCGRCVVACPSDRLVRRLPMIAATVLVSFLAVPTAFAHHNKGLPHYGYYDNYPQVPTEEYVAIDGKWEIGATIFNFQGYERQDSDTPNDIKIFLYIYDLTADEGYVGPLAVEIRHRGEVISRFERLKVDEESVYSTRQTLPHSGTYEIAALLGETEIVLPFYVELADEIDWWLIAGITIPVLLVFGLALLGRRGRRKRSRRPGKIAGALSAVLVLWLAATPALAEEHQHGAETMHEPAQKHMQHEEHAMPSADPAMQHYETEAGAVMVMRGIPLWLFLAGVVLLIVFTFVVTEWRGSTTKRGFRYNLIENKRMYAFVRSRWFQAIPQLLMASVLIFLIYAGLFGSRVANITPIAVWTVWWAGLIFTVLLLASTWCFICPWDALANLASRLRLAAKTEPLSIGMKFPPWLANMYPAILLFGILTWLELGYGVTTNPRTTAYMGLGMAAMAIVAALLWDGKKFCAHACPVGRICGIYSNFSPIEIRAKKERVCQSCKTEDCLYGDADGYPCPTGISLKVVNDATMCTMCTECIKSCKKQNVAINLRPFGADLSSTVHPRLDEAWLALTLLALTLFHGLSMTPLWENFAPGGFSILKWMGLTFGTPQVLNFTLAMLFALAIPIGLYWLSCVVADRLTGRRLGVRQLFRDFAFSLLPVALFYHIAHNLMHLLSEGPEIVPLLSDPLGTGADFFGTSGMHMSPLVSEGVLWGMQVGLILVGHAFGVVVAHRFAHGRFDTKALAIRSLIPITVMMILISTAGLSLMHMDMNMRVGRM